MEIERIREKALLTDEEIAKIKPSHKELARIMKESETYEPKEFKGFFLGEEYRKATAKAIAQAQIDKLLKFVRIEADDQSVPEYLDWSPRERELVQKCYRLMLKPDSKGNVWVKCLKKEEK